jgi:hypothetical protein
VAVKIVACPRGWKTPAAICLKSKIQKTNLGNGVPFRTLTWSTKRNWNNGSMFYDNNNLPVIDQYDILKNSKFPVVNIVPDNFWGAKPPL